MKTHPLNAGYLVIGLVFLGISASWALRVSDTISAGSLHWVLPLVLVVAGLVGLGAMAIRGAARVRQAEDDDPTSEPGDLS